MKIELIETAVYDYFYNKTEETPKHHIGDNYAAKLTLYALAANMTSMSKTAISRRYKTSRTVIDNALEKVDIYCKKYPNEEGLIIAKIVKMAKELEKQKNGLKNEN